MKKLLVLIVFIPLILTASVISRSEIMTCASGFSVFGWTVNATNPEYNVYAISGTKIVGEAYSFGDKATTVTFGSEINAGLKPRNWEDPDNPGYPANPSSEYTGIDCSGLVTRCWCFGNQVDWVGVSHLYNYTIGITGEPKTGDLWWNQYHVFLQGDSKGWVFEANPLEDPYGGNRVQYKRNTHEDYTKRSIFPQFSSPKPEDGIVLEDSQTVNISLTIKASGELVDGGVKMFVQKSGEVEKYIGDAELTKVNDNEWEFKKENFDVEDGGKYIVRIIARNDVTISQVSPSVTNGYLDEYHWWFIVNADSTPPMVVSTNPSDGATDVQVDINPITIAFSKVMDTSSTQGAISSTPAISYTTSWTNEDKTLNLNPDDYLDYCEEYKVTISDDATDTAGVQLDGDEDGEPGGTYTFFFTTQTPPLSLNIDPSIYHFELEELGNCESKSGNVIINGSNLLKEVSCKLSKTVDGNGLSFSGGEGTFTISAGGSQNTDFTVTGCEEGGISVKLKATSPNDTRKTYATTAGGYSASIKEKNDHPDENQSPGPTVYPTPFILKSDSAYSSENVGIFIYGWTIGYAHILGEYGIPIIPFFSDFTYWKNPDTTLSDVVNLVVIGSGALSGFNSSQFAQKLADYVQSGGNLLVLTQKFGNDFSVLPGVVEGYGWREDQSCFRNAAYLNQWHPVFSGQTEQVMSCNVDGYITQCPDYADVLLRRTANGMPALLSYSYGAGRVLVSSLYPDWGYGHNQTSTEELRLLRDITTWALNPDMPIPEFYPDSNVSISVKINYFADDTVEATTAIIKVFTPDRVLYDSIAVPVSLQPGDEIQWDWNESSLPQNLGLWIIDYALMDGSSEEIQSFERGAIFAQRVDVPVGDYNLGDFLMWVNSDYEEVIAGDTVNYEVYIRNNTDSFFSGKVIVGVNHGTHVVDSITDLSIPSDTVIKILYQNPQWQSCLGGLWFSLYASDDTSGKYIARCERKAREIFHPFRVSLSKDKNPYLMGYDTVHYIAELDNEGNYPCSVKIEIYTVLDSIRYDVEIDTLNLSHSGAILEGGFFPWDYDSTAIGKGYLYCNLFYKDSLRNSRKTLYNLTYPNVQCSLSLPDSFCYNDTNLYTVTLSSERDYLPPGMLLLTGKDYFDSLTINRSSNSDTTLTFNYQPDEWWANDWIKAEYRYGDQASSWKLNLPFAFPGHSPVAIRAVPYDNTFLPGDTARFSGWVRGRGKLYEAPVIGWVANCPPEGDTLWDTTIVNPDSNSFLSFATFIDTAVSSGEWYTYDIQLKYLGGTYGGTVIPGYQIHPPMAILNWLNNDTFPISDSIPITYSNPIKTTARVRLDSIVLYNNDIHHKDIGPGEISVLPESSYTYLVDIPEWTSGEYKLKVYSEITKGEGGGWGFFEHGGYWRIFIEGIESQFSVRSEKDWFNVDDDITINSLLHNGDFTYTGGIETLFVYPFEETTKIVSLEAGDADLYGIRLKDSAGVQAALIDSVYSLYEVREYEIDCWNLYIASDEWGNIWLRSESNVKKFDRDFNEMLLSFTFPDSISSIADFTLKDGWMYLSDRGNGMVRKINATTGDLVDSWGLRGGSFPLLQGISVSDDGRVIVVDDGLKRLYRFTCSGSLLDSLDLPSSLSYGDLEFGDGKIFISSGDRILTVSGGVIDTFVSSDVINYGPISVSKDGKVAVLDGYDVILYSKEGELEVISGVMGNAYDLVFNGEDILRPWFIPEKNRKDRFGPFVSRFREYGVDKGFVRFDPSSVLPSVYTFLDYYPDDDPQGGSINYKGRQGNDTEVPLESLKGTHSLPFIDVELEGDWQDSPIFRSLGLEIRTLAKDTLIYSNTHPINLLPGEEHLVGDTITDSLSAGDYAVLGDLYTNIGQSVHSDIDYFTVIGDEVSLLMHPDTNDVPVGWTFQPNIQVINPLPDSQGGLHLIVRTEDSVYLDTTFTMDSSSVDTFPVSVSPLVPVILAGELTIPANDTLNKDITLNVIGGVVTLDVSTVDIAGLEPFVLRSELENHSAIPQPVILKRRWSSDSLIDTVLVSEGETVLLLDSLSITQSETLNVVASGSFGEEEENLLVEFGIRGDITMDSLYQVAPDSIEMTGIIRNDGVYPVNLVVLFCLVEDTVGRGDLPLQMEKAVWFPYDQSAKLVEAIHELPLLQESRDWEVAPTRIRGPDPYSKSARQERTRYILSLQHLRDIKRVGKDLSFEEFIDEIVRADIDTSLSYLYLSPGETDTIPIMFDFNDPGNYTIIGYLFTETLSVFLDSSSSSVNVIENSLVSIDSMLLSPYCDSTGSVPFSVLLSNQSYNSFNGSLTLVSPVCYLDTIVNIPSQSQDTIIFCLEGPIDEGEYIFTASLKEGGIILSEKQSDFYFRPIYQFDSLPDELNAAVGDTGDISLSVSNIGNGRGERTISAQWVDVINLSLNAIIEPYSDSVFTQGFVVPLDLPGGKYYCDVRILNGAYPEVDTFIPIHIEGVYLTAEDSLDKLVYKIGDTVDFSILIENKGMWSGSLDATIQYGDFSLDTSFILGGMERGVCNDSFPRDTLYLDTFGVYLFDPINTTSYDSLQIQWSASTDSLEFSLRTDSTVGGGNWIVSDTGVVYPVEQWTQVRIINESVDTVWVDSIVLFFYPQDTLILDTFPLQREILSFDVPVSETDKKAGWGIYHPSGRSIVLDERYIYLEDDSLTVFTGKDRYESLDTVYATLYKHFPGTDYEFHYWVYFSPTQIVEDSFALTEDTMEFALLIPEWVRSGSYSIDWWVEEITGKENSEIRSEVDRYDMKNKVGRSGDVHTVQPPSFFNRGQKPAPTRGQDVSCPYKPDKGRKPSAKEWVLGKVEPERNDSAIITGSHPFDVSGITIYFAKALMDTNWYLIRDTARVWMDISSDITMNCSLILSSTGSVVDTHSLSLNKDIPNYYEFEYRLIDCRRGMNELYLHLLKDSMSLAGEVLYFDIFVPDSIPPMLSIIKEPSNTYSSSEMYEIKARIWDPDSNGTPLYDTLYYRLSSVGGCDWQSLLTHSIRGDTHQYLIPSQPNGSLIQYYLTVQDSFGNLARYPEEGEKEFWVLLPMRPTWSELTYTQDTTAILQWNPPQEMLTYHCGLSSDTVNINEKIIATRFIPQYLPARLNGIGVCFANEDIIPIDTAIIHIYQVEDSIPGIEMDSFSFVSELSGYEELDISGVQIPEEGLFVGISGSPGLGIVLDGFGNGSHTAVYQEGEWSLSTSGEALMNGFLSYLPSSTKRQSSILYFNLLRSYQGDTNWTEIASGISDTMVIDTTVVENNGYSYKVEANFSEPEKSFFSGVWSLFIDLTPPELDTIILSSIGEDTIQISVTLIDTSGIGWDSLSYERNDSLIVIPSDSSIGNEYFFTIYFDEDTLKYFIQAVDSSLMENYARYPEDGFYKWFNPTGISDENYPDSTYLANLPENPITRRVSIEYALCERGQVKIVLYDVVGRMVKTLVDEVKERGYYSVLLGRERMPQGVYFLRMDTRDYKRTLKLVKLF